MLVEICVAARDLNSLLRNVGPITLLQGWSVHHAVVVHSQTGPQLWIGSERAPLIQLADLWKTAFPDRPILPGYHQAPAYNPQSALLRGFEYVRVPLRPRGATLDRWVPQKASDDPLLWAIFSSPEMFV